MTLPRQAFQQGCSVRPPQDREPVAVSAPAQAAALVQVTGRDLGPAEAAAQEARA